MKPTKPMRPKAKKGTLRRLLREVLAFYPVLIPVTIACILFSAVVSSVPSLFMQNVIEQIELHAADGNWAAAKAPILPMYMVKREKWYQRQRMVMGQPIDVAKELGPMPSMQDMNRLTELLREKELELERYYQSLPVYQKK